jgi:hypothetical protein
LFTSGSEIPLSGDIEAVMKRGDTEHVFPRVHEKDAKEKG